MAFAKAVVAAARPRDANRAKALLYAASRLGAFASSLGLALDPGVLFQPAFVERFVASAKGLSAPTRRTLRTNLVPEGDLQGGNALISGGTQLATFIGPAAGGVLIAFVGASVAFGFDAASFVVSAVCLAGIRSYGNHRRAHHTAFAAGPPIAALSPQAEPAGVTKGRTVLRFVMDERVLQIILVIAVVANLASGGVTAVALAALAHDPYHAGAAGYGALISAFGAGALVGTLGAAQTRLPRRPAFVASGALLIEAGLLAGVPYLGGVAPAAAALAAYGALNGLGNVTTLTALQRWCPAQMAGRLLSLLLIASYGVYPLSTVLAGYVVRSFGPPAFFPLPGALLAVAVLTGLSQRDWRNFAVQADRALPRRRVRASSQKSRRGPRRRSVGQARADDEVLRLSVVISRGRRPDT